MTTTSSDQSTPEEPSSTFRSAVGWSFVLSGGQRLFGFLVTMLLAAILGPESYGTVAMALVFVSLTQVFLLQGLLPALIQRRDLDRSQMTSAFWTGMALSVVLAGLVVGISGWWADVNDLPELQGVILALTPLLPLSALMVVQEAWLRRRLEFKKLALRANVSVIGGGILGILAAALGAGIWALVVQQLATQVIGVVVLWRVSSWRPSFHFAYHDIKDLISFSASSSASAVGNFVNTSGDALVIGFFFGPAAVGLYQLAYRVVLTVVEVLSLSLQGVALPELSRLQRDREAVRSRLDDLLALAGRTTIPTLAILAAVSPWFVAILGGEWTAAATTIRILAAVGVMRVFTVFSGPLMQATNHPHLLAVLAWSVSALSLGFGIAAGLLLQDTSIAVQVNGMALANVVLFLIIVAINAWVYKAYGSLGYAAQFATLRTPLVAGTLSLAAGLLLQASGLLDDAAVAGVLVVGTVSALVAAAVLLGRDPQSRDAVDVLRQRLRRAPT